MVMTAVLLCSVGLVVNVITTAGVGNVFSLQISTWADGNLLIAIALVALASLVLGMGLPVTAAYIVLATLSAPAIAGMISDRAVIDALADGALPHRAGDLHARRARGDVPAGRTHALGGRRRPRGEPAHRGRPAPARPGGVSRGCDRGASVGAYDHLLAQPGFERHAARGARRLHRRGHRQIARHGDGCGSWKLAKGLYIVPVLFAYTPFLSGDWGAALVIFGFGTIGIYGLSAALCGSMEAPINWFLRAAALAAGLAALWPDALLVNVAGAIVVFLILAWSIRGDRRRNAIA
jgi:hypothetical protein